MNKVYKIQLVKNAQCTDMISDDLFVELQICSPDTLFASFATAKTTCRYLNEALQAIVKRDISSKVRYEILEVQVED